MNKGFGISAIFVALVAMVMPVVVNLFVIYLAMILAIVAALAGDRIFATVAPIISAVGLLLLSPLTLAYLTTDSNPQGGPLLMMITLVFLAAPFVAMFLNATGKLVLNRKASA